MSRLSSRRHFLQSTCLTLASVVATSSHANATNGAESWPQYAYDPEHTSSPSNNTGPSEQVGVSWKAQVGDFHYQPAVVDGTIYLGAGGYVWAFDTASGAEQWRFEPVGTVNGIAVSNDRVLFTTERETPDGPTGTVYALTTTGTEIWNNDSTGSIMGPPTVLDQTLYVSSSEGVHLLNVDDGSEQVRFENIRGILGPAVDSETLYVGTAGGVVAVNRTDGTEQWRIDTGNGNPVYCVVASGETVFAGTYPSGDVGSLYALAAEGGDQQWSLEIDRGMRSPTISDGMIYAGLDSLHKIDASDGTVQWRSSVGGIEPVLVDGTVYFAGVDHVHAVDAQDGTELWNFETGEYTTYPVVVDNVVYVGAGGVLYALSPEAPTPSATDSPTTESTVTSTTQTSESSQTVVQTSTRTPTPTPTQNLNLSLTGTRTNVTIDELASITFSAVNFVGNEPLTVQLIVESPSGVSVSSVSGASSGSNQYTGVFTLDPGQSRDVRVALQANQPGTYTVSGIAVYYFGDEETATSRFQQDLSLTIQPVQTTVNDTQMSQSTTSGTGAGFGPLSIGAGLVGWGSYRLASQYDKQNPSE